MSSATLTAIRAAQKDAMRNRDAEARSLLSTLVAEAAMVGKNAVTSNGYPDPRDATEAEVLKVVKDFIKKARETQDSLTKLGRTEDAAAYGREIEILGRFLPEAPNEEAMLAVIDEVVRGLEAPSMKDMRTVLGALDEKFGNSLDRAMAAKLTKSRLNG